MKVLNLEPASGWCEERGIASTCVGKRVELQYADNGRQCVRATLTTQSPPVIAMALLLQDLAEPDPKDFGGCLVWLREWGIWNEYVERAGDRMLGTLRRGMSESNVPAISDTPAQVFGPQEFIDAQVLVTVPLIFQWDAYVVPASARCVIRISHDDYIQVDACSRTVLSRITERFRLLNWNPRECAG